MINDRAAARLFFHQAWSRHQAGAVLEPLEALVASVIAMHPEYHALIAEIELACSAPREFAEDSNPFLHLGLHVALLEQVQADRPAGIRAVYHALKTLLAGDTHTAEHQMIAVLAHALTSAQARREMPDERAYVARLQALIL